MKVRSLKIQSFRNIDDLSLEFDRRLTVFLGVNGSGKSSILDALATLLNCLPILLKVPDTSLTIHQKNHSKKNGSSINSELQKRINRRNWMVTVGALRNFLNNFSNAASPPFNIKNGSRNFSNTIVIQFNESNVEWSLTKTIDSGYVQRNREWHGLIDLASRIKANLETDNQLSIPLTTYYSTDRLFSASGAEPHDFQVLNPLDAIDDSLNRSGKIFDRFFQWFRYLEDLENEERRDKPNHRNCQLSAIRNAIPQFLTGFSDLRIRRSPSIRMTISKGGEELVINQLSDGEKCLLAMVGDLARRLSIANPGLEDPLKGEGIVLIDELELHLHPQWQRGIISKLLETFPNCQFIISTHSPQIISDVKPENIYVLKSVDNKITATHPYISFGRDSNQILETVMGVSARPEMIKNQLNDLFRLIDEGKIEEAKVLKSTLSDEIGLDEPQFSKANVLIRRQEILGR